MRRLLRYPYANSMVVGHKLYKKAITQSYGNENALPYGQIPLPKA